MSDDDDHRRHLAVNPPPFPTFFPGDQARDEAGGQQVSSQQDEDKIGQQVHVMYDKEIHQFSHPTIVFQEDESEKKVVRTGAKLAKVRSKK